MLTSGHLQRRLQLSGEDSPVPGLALATSNHLVSLATTSHRVSLATTSHRVSLTSHCVTLTSHCVSLATTSHRAFLTSHCVSLATNSHCVSLATTSHCVSLATTSHRVSLAATHSHPNTPVPDKPYVAAVDVQYSRYFTDRATFPPAASLCLIQF